MTINVFAEVITATCYSPKGQRIDLIKDKFKVDEDGFSNSNPTFYFSSDKPDVLIESWQAALPFPELLNREDVDKIVPPTVTKSVVIHHSEEVIHAIAPLTGNEGYTTTLYLNQNAAVFTRVKIKGIDTVFSWPMGAVYTSRCSFNRVK